MKINTVKTIDVNEWNKLVSQVYGRPYSFQQQNSCRDRRIFYLTIPDHTDDEDMYDSIPEIVGHQQMGIKFKSWLNRDPKKLINNSESSTKLWWERNFYPDINVMANDLYERGWIKAGEYMIIIDW